MTPDRSRSNVIALRVTREQTIARLSDAFANDMIDVDDFERRLTLAHRATTVAEVEATAADLDAASSAVALAPAPAAPLLAADVTAAMLVAVLGGVERRGAWRVPRRLHAIAVLGGMVLDLREAVLPAGTIDIEVVAVMGGVQILVPPLLSVEVFGNAFLGGFAHMERAPSDPDPERPLIRIRGLAIMGGVAVETRLPGESEVDAHRRRNAVPALRNGRGVPRLR